MNSDIIDFESSKRKEGEMRLKNTYLILLMVFALLLQSPLQIAAQTSNETPDTTNEEEVTTEGGDTNETTSTETSLIENVYIAELNQDISLRNSTQNGKQRSFIFCP
jgi:hypothetical protein